MKEYDDTKYLVISRKAVTFHKVCRYLIETLGVIIGLSTVLLILLWSLLQVLLVFRTLISAFV
jgi:hypothetical protein